MRISPQPRPWSRAIVVGVMLALGLRYLLWRSLATLNVGDPLNGVFSLGLWLAELSLISSGLLQLFLSFKKRDHRYQADQLQGAVLNGTFTPSVDILIPTYNESALILRRTVIGCQALTYPHQRIYLLDDTRRHEVRALAQELGCEYMTRPDNRHAKAGNLNHAIAHTTGELVAVFDADFIPTQNFLSRTVGFFQNPQVALVQTPQYFYNSDPINRTLGTETSLTSEEEMFHRHVQAIRNGMECVVCSGTSFVARRSALEAVGGFVTESLTEDYFTGIRLSAQGYQLIYLNEILSVGMAAENMSAFTTQRLRWLQGTFQSLFIDSNPLTLRGLNFLQRLSHGEILLFWLNHLSRFFLLLIPAAYTFLGVVPVWCTTSEVWYFFVPYYLIHLSVFNWNNGRSRSAIDVRCLPACSGGPGHLNNLENTAKALCKGLYGDTQRNHKPSSHIQLASGLAADPHVWDHGIEFKLCCRAVPLTRRLDHPRCFPNNGRAIQRDQTLLDLECLQLGDVGCDLKNTRGHAPIGSLPVGRSTTNGENTV